MLIKKSPILKNILTLFAIVSRSIYKVLGSVVIFLTKTFSIMIATASLISDYIKLGCKIEVSYMAGDNSFKEFNYRKPFVKFSKHVSKDLYERVKKQSKQSRSKVAEACKVLFNEMMEEDQNIIKHFYGMLAAPLEELKLNYSSVMSQRALRDTAPKISFEDVSFSYNILSNKKLETSKNKSSDEEEKNIVNGNVSNNENPSVQQTELTNTEDKKDSSSLETTKSIIDVEKKTKANEQQVKTVLIGNEQGARVLDGFNLLVEPGKTIALCGYSGNGKSTCVKLLSRMYNVTAGAIKINDIDIRQIPLSVLRRNITYMNQDTVVLDEESGFNNIFLEKQFLESIFKKVIVDSVIDYINNFNMPEKLERKCPLLYNESYAALVPLLIKMISANGYKFSPEQEAVIEKIIEPDENIDCCSENFVSMTCYNSNSSEKKKKTRYFFSLYKYCKKVLIGFGKKILSHFIWFLKLITLPVSPIIIVWGIKHGNKRNKNIARDYMYLHTFLEIQKIVINAGISAAIDPFLSSLKDGYMKNLSLCSGGQNQRICLARIFARLKLIDLSAVYDKLLPDTAIVMEPLKTIFSNAFYDAIVNINNDSFSEKSVEKDVSSKIKGKIVILDEFSSSLDEKTEKYVTDTLFRENSINDTTRIIIAHRMSTVLMADEIFIIDKGKIVESGTHSFLLKNGKVYPFLCQSLSVKK